MKILISKYKFFFIFYLPIFIFTLVICLYKTSYSVTTTGDITNLSDYFIVEDSNNVSGSFNSIFVYSTDNATLFQKWVGSIDSKAVVEEESSNYTTFSTSDLNLMGKIQKTQSIEASIITAYNAAKEVNDNINIDYSLKGYIVRYLVNDNNQFKLGDIIISINGVTPSNENFRDAYKNMLEGSSVIVLRDNEELTLTLNSNSANYIEDEKTYSKISIYEKYDINYDTITPKINIKSQNTLGPSAGLLQALSIYNMLISDDITSGLKIAGTGTISAKGSVGAIGGIRQKVITAYKNNCDIFICPKANYDEGYDQYKKLKTKMKFIVAESFSQILEDLYESINQ